MDESTRRILAVVADELGELAGREVGHDAATLAEMSASLLRAALAPSPARDAGPAPDLRELVASARAHVDALYSEREGPSASGSGERLSPDRVGRYLRTRPEPHWRRAALSVTYQPGGFSKETIFVRLAGGEEPQELVLRKVVDGQAAGTLEQEWEILGRAARAGLPVPAPFWIETDSAPLGNAFFAVARAPGRNLGDVWGRATDVPSGVGRELARALATLHQLNAADVSSTPAPPMSTAPEISRLIDACQGLARAAAGAEHPELYEALIQWLRENPPPPPARPALLHGDIGFHNILVDGARLGAILDWERAHVGDPAEELAYVHPSLEGTMAWSDFEKAYTEAGGELPDPAAFRFFEVWRDVWRATACLVLRQRFLGDAAPTLRDGVAGLTYYPRFLLSAARTAFPEAA